MINYNERLDEILQPIIEKAISDGEGVVYEFSTDFDRDIPEVTSKYLKLKNEAKQSILDWHNKQVEELLDRLEADVWRRMANTSVITIINDERKVIERIESDE